MEGFIWKWMKAASALHPHGRITGQGKEVDGERDSWPEALEIRDLVAADHRPYFPVHPTGRCGHFNQCVFYKKAREGRAESWDVIVTKTMILVLADLRPGAAAAICPTRADLPVHLR